MPGLQRWRLCLLGQTLHSADRWLKRLERLIPLVLTKSVNGAVFRPLNPKKAPPTLQLQWELQPSCS
eukprot:3342761-Prorocentrum_lima.AAC.1